MIGLSTTVETRMTDMRRRIRCAQGEEPADLVLKNCTLANVHLDKPQLGDIVVLDGRIVGIRKDFDGPAAQFVDCSGMYAAPGFVHVLSPGQEPHMVPDSESTTAFIHANGDASPERAYAVTVGERGPKQFVADTGSLRVARFHAGGSTDRSLRALLRTGQAVVLTDDVPGWPLSEMLQEIVEQELDTRNMCFGGTSHPLSTAVDQAIQAGIPPLRAIQMATLNPVQLFGLEHEIGSLTPGRWADVILAPGFGTPKPQVAYWSGVNPPTPATS